MRLCGRGADFERLFEAFAVDSRRIRERFDWSPPASMDEGLRRAATGALAD
jgi:hypothetical protein